MISKMRKILQSEDIRRLLKNFFSLSVLKLINAILPFVTLPYLIKVLGFQQYGAIVLALSLIAYFQSITDYGFNLSATREIARHRSSQKQLSFIYSKTIISKIYLLIFSLILLVSIIFLVPQFKEDLAIYFLMCLMLIGQTLFPEWFFRGVEQMGYITILDLIIKLSFTIGVFSLIKVPQDYWLYPFLLGLSYILVAIISHYLIIKKFNLNVYFIKSAHVRKNLKQSFPLFINQFVPNLFNNTTNFLVGIILGNTAAGLFGATRQVIQILTVFNSVVSIVFFPYLIRNKSNFSIFSKLYFLIILTVSLILIFFHKIIFKLIGINYPQESEIFFILLLGFLSIVLYSIYSTNYLIARGHDKVVMKLTIVASILGFILIIPLINYFGVLGGAINIFICQFILGMGSYFYFIKYSKGEFNAI